MSIPPTSGWAPPVVARASTIMPAQVPSTGRPSSISSRSAAEQAGALGDQPERRALAAGQHDRVEPGEVGRGAHLDRVGADGREGRPVLGERPLHREHADARPPEAREGLRSPPPALEQLGLGKREISSPGIASLRPSRGPRQHLGVGEVGHGLDDRARPPRRVGALVDARSRRRRPRRRAASSAPRRRAWRCPPAEKFTTGRRALGRHLATSS